MKAGTSSRSGTNWEKSGRAAVVDRIENLCDIPNNEEY